MNKVKFIIILFLLPMLVVAQSARKLLIEGDFFMGMDNYEEAENYYAAASSKKPSFKSYYNTGVAQEMQISSSGSESAAQVMQEPEENPMLKKAILSYATATGLAKDPVNKSRAYYNMGNTHKADEKMITIEKLESAIESYKKAIENDSINYRARHNLAITQLQLDQAKEQEQQQQQQQQDQEENEDQEKQEQNQEQNQDQQQQDQEQQEDQEQESQEQQENEQQQNEDAKQQEEEEKKEITKAEMEKILEMVEKEDQEVQQKMRAKAQPSSTEKKKKW